MQSDQSLYTVQNVCDIFKCGQSTIWRWVASGTFPKPLKIGGTSRWTHAAVAETISKAENRTIDPEPNPPGPKGSPRGGKRLKLSRR